MTVDGSARTIGGSAVTACGSARAIGESAVTVGGSATIGGSAVTVDELLSSLELFANDTKARKQ